MVTNDDTSIESLFALHYRSVLRFAYLLSGGRDHEDLVQEAMLRAYRRWDRAAAPEAFRTYAQTIVLRLHLNRLRSAGREARAMVRLRATGRAHEDSAPPVDAVRAVSALPPRMRAAVVLKYFEDLSEEDIAERMRCRPGTVRSLLFQAREKLRAAGYGTG
jgi:RNA polymerase sigma factor (sigma-70 family)